MRNEEMFLWIECGLSAGLTTNCESIVSCGYWCNKFNWLTITMDELKTVFQMTVNCTEVKNDSYELATSPAVK